MTGMLALLLFVLFATPAQTSKTAAPEKIAAPAAEWQTLAPGLDLGEFLGPPSAVGDRRIRVLRVDPARFTLKLLSASADDKQPRSARDWCARSGAVAAINASMFRDDHRTSVSLMKSPGHVNNARLSKDNSVLAFDRATDGVPEIQLIDRTCQDFEKLQPSYRTLVQSIRLVTCERKNSWGASAKKWSTAAVGVDGAGRVLFIHARSPWPVHELVDALLALPIDLRRAMYTEGGPEAQLFIKAGKTEREFLGSYETGFMENDDNHEAWAIPNVIAAIPRR